MKLCARDREPKSVDFIAIYYTSDMFYPLPLKRIDLLEETLSVPKTLTHPSIQRAKDFILDFIAD